MPRHTGQGQENTQRTCRKVVPFLRGRAGVGARGGGAVVVEEEGKGKRVVSGLGLAYMTTARRMQEDVPRRDSCTCLDE